MHHGRGSNVQGRQVWERSGMLGGGRGRHIVGWSRRVPNDHWVRIILTFLDGRFLWRSSPLSLLLCVLDLLLLSWRWRRRRLLLRGLWLQRRRLRLRRHLLRQLRNPSHGHLNLRRHRLRSTLHRLRYLCLLSRKLLASLHLLQKYLITRRYIPESRGSSIAGL